MFRHESRDEVVNLPLSACDRHGAIIGEWKAKSKQELKACITRRAVVVMKGAPLFSRSVREGGGFDLGF